MEIVKPDRQCSCGYINKLQEIKVIKIYKHDDELVAQFQCYGKRENKEICDSTMTRDMREIMPLIVNTNFELLADDLDGSNILVIEIGEDMRIEQR